MESTESRNHNKTVMWRCVCSCGIEAIVPSTKLKSGEIKSCGCKEHVRSARTPMGHSGLNKLYSDYRYGAKSRSLEFAVSIDEFKSIVTSNCTYCGVEPNRVTYGSRGSKKEHGKFLSTGVDRIDSSKGYTVDNVVPCCSICNIAKSDLTQSEFLAWIDRIRNFTNA